MRSYSYILILIILGLWSWTSAKDFGQDTAKIKHLMHTFDEQLSKLRPYIVSDEKFNSPEAKKAVGEAIRTLDNDTKMLSSNELERVPGFRITLRLLRDHFTKTSALYKNGEFEYTRLMLNSAPSYCVTCHTQLPETSRKYDFIDSFYKRAPTFDNCEFMFITRRFDRALEGYDDLTKNFPNSDISAEYLPLIYRRKLAIFARVKRDPELAIKSLRKDLKNKQLPADIRNNIEVWIGYFEAWKAQKEDPEKMSDAKLLEYVEKSVLDEEGRKIAPADPRAVTYLRVSGLLYERVANRKDDTLVPDMLYYLGVSEKNIGSLYWYSLGDTYFAECITKYPHRPTTKKCFEAYKKSVMSRYKTEGAIPQETRDSLESYRKYL